MKYGSEQKHIFGNVLKYESIMLLANRGKKNWNGDY
jgi:hypothetical protein